MIIYRGLRNRPDRRAVPVPFRRGGLLLHPKFVELNCMYCVDAGTYNLNDPDLPGCSGHWCDPLKKGRCGFGNMGAAWRPTDLKLMLEQHAKFGAPFGGIGFHSGYNEVIHATIPTLFNKYAHYFVMITRS